MNPTDVLRTEHRVIERVLECLEELARQAAETGTLDVEGARSAVEFLRNFADGSHHMKEEHTLFPALEESGFSATHGPTAVMRHEHETGRAFVHAMDTAIAGVASGDEGAPRAFADAAAEFAQLLAEHIDKEDHVLFPMADNNLPPERKHALMDRFRSLDDDTYGAAAHRHYVALANALCDRLGLEGVPVTATEPPTWGCE